jgi:hypothetical protein
MGEALTGVEPAVINRAGQLIDDAAQRGVTLTWPEAIQQVTNSGTSLANLQRVVEGSQQGGALRHVMAERPNQIQHAFDQQMDEIAAVPMRPYTVGPQIAQASEEAINATRQQINRIAEPHYARASTATVPARTMDTLRHLPGWDEALAAVRGNPQLARYVEGLPDNSVGVLNEVKKYLNQRARNVGAVTDPNRNMQQSAGYRLDADAVRDTGRRSSGEYGRALAGYSRAGSTRSIARIDPDAPDAQSRYKAAHRTAKRKGLIREDLECAPDEIWRNVLRP